MITQWKTIVGEFCVALAAPEMADGIDNFSESTLFTTRRVSWVSAVPSKDMNLIPLHLDKTFVASSAFKKVPLVVNIPHRPFALLFPRGLTSVDK